MTNQPKPAGGLVGGDGCLPTAVAMAIKRSGRPVVLSSSGGWAQSEQALQFRHHSLALAKGSA